jgi:alginate O-acetyltransferase complex protein AlgJ
MKARIYPEFLPADFRWSAASLTAYEALRSGMAEGPAVVPDLAGLFSALRRSQPESLFFKGDTHWTPVAAAATAETLVRALSTRPRLPPNPHGGMTLGRWVPLDFAAADLDLAKQLPEPMRARWKAERYQLRMMPRPTGLLEVEAEGADVTLVGNSYSFPGFGLGANLSEKLARPLNLFARVGREGHWRTMLNYLESSLFRQQRPRLLVWQLIEGSLSLPPDERGFFGDNAMTGDAFLRDLRRLVQPA